MSEPRVVRVTEGGEIVYDVQSILDSPNAREHLRQLREGTVSEMQARAEAAEAQVSALRAALDEATCNDYCGDNQGACNCSRGRVLVNTYAAAVAHDARVRDEAYRAGQLRAFERASGVIDALVIESWPDP